VQCYNTLLTLATLLDVSDGQRATRNPYTLNPYTLNPKPQALNSRPSAL